MHPLATRLAIKHRLAHRYLAAVDVSPIETKLLLQAKHQRGSVSVTTEHVGRPSKGTDYKAGGRNLAALQSLVKKGLLESLGVERISDTKQGESRFFMDWSFKLTAAGQAAVSEMKSAADSGGSRRVRPSRPRRTSTLVTCATRTALTNNCGTSRMR